MEMERYEVQGFAATWGSYMTGGDPGACMYGFDETGYPQNETHKADCIAYMQKNRERVAENPADYDDDELDKIDAFIALMQDSPVSDPDPELTVKELMSEFRLMCDDSWGTTMSFWFAVCHEMNHRGLDIPAEWKFRPGAAKRDLDTMEGVAVSRAYDEDLERFGAIMARYADLLKRHGKSY